MRKKRRLKQLGVKSKQDNPHEHLAWCQAECRHWINNGEVGY